MTTTTERRQKPRNLVQSIERGLDRMLTSPTQRLQEMREEMQREENSQRHRVEVRSREYRETLLMAAQYLRDQSTQPSS